MNLVLDEPKTMCYTWGSMADRKIETIPKKIDIGSSTPIVRIYAGSKQVSIAVTSSGDVYSWGKGNIGRRCKISAQNIPVQIKGIRKIESVSLGEDHGIFRDREGNVYSFGDPSDNKLGLSDLKAHVKVISPRKVLLKGTCKLVACGQTTSTLLVSSNNETDVIMFGSHRGLLQKGHRSNKMYPTRVLRTSLQVTRLSSGANHVLAIVNKTVFGWGSTENGRLGIEKENSSKIIVEPVEITWFRENMICINDIALGSAHSIVLSEGGSIYTFGWNLYYQCGHNRTDDILEPSLLKHCDDQIESVHAGFGHSAAITINGRLLCWGFNEEGQCGVGNEENIIHPTPVNFNEDDAKAVVSVALGGTHTVAVVSLCSKSEYMEQRALIDKMNRALGLLRRFSRHVLMRLRLRLFERKESIESNDTKDEEHDISGDQKVGIGEIEGSESSVDSDTSDSTSEAHGAPIIFTSHISEIFAMQEEDEQSRIFQQELKRLYMEKMRAKDRMRQEIQRRFHVACMCKEDLQCLRWRAERKLHIKEARRVKQDADHQRRLELSHYRGREALKCKLPTKKKETKSVKKHIRTVTRRKVSICRNDKANISNQAIVESPKTNESPMNLHRKRNEMLLRKRGARLKKQRETAEAERKKMATKQAEQQRQQKLDDDKKRTSIMENVKRLESDLRHSKISTAKILSEMRNESNRLVSISDPIDLKPLRTVDEWSKELNV